jgi:hypothetical protein
MAHQFQPQFGVFRAVVRAICVEQGKYEDEPLEVPTRRIAEKFILEQRNSSREIK